jgi:hypothetical protein
MSAGYPWLTTGIPVGKPTGLSYLSLQVHTDLSFCSGCCEYLSQVLVRLRYFIYLFPDHISKCYFNF